MRLFAARTALGLAFVIGAPWLVQTQDRSDQENERPAPTKLVLDRAATIEFTTDEGTWMSLDVSPDGRTIVFDLLGDIYTLPIDGGTAQRIIGGMSFESQPKFSPDGRSIAFLSDRSGVENLWIANVDGTDPRPVSKDRPTFDSPQEMCSPSWSADGQYLLVSKLRAPDRTYGVFMYDKNGGSGIRVGSAPPPPPPPGDNQGPPRPVPNRLGAVASPDGRFIYYAERTGRFSYNVRFPLWQIHRFDRDTGEAATITNAQGSAMRPLLSPDGKLLVYATRHEIHTGLRLRNLETGDERWLIYPVTRDDQESAAVSLHDDPKIRRFIPHELYDTMVRRRAQWFLPDEYGHRGIARGIADVVHAGGRAGARQPRTVSGSRRALGDLGPAIRRPHASRNPACGDALWRRVAGAAEGSRIDRTGEAGRSDRPRQESPH